ncbi:MAG TPA: FAD-binding protein [Polyangiaceae bacterium]|nr:FAD-binding protein [Polyangiaceae bacterium]
MTMRSGFLALLLSLLGAAGCAAHGSPQVPKTASSFDCKPGLPCWPTADEWQRLGASLTGRLEVPQSPLEACRADATSSACAAVLGQLKNPFYVEDQSAGTQSAGWLGAWTAASSAYAVVAKNAEDVARAVNFARAHGLRLVIKGTGHDYLGRSNAPDSLLVWTHEMRQVTLRDAFVGTGCPNTQPGTPAVSVEAGARWMDAYDEVTVKHARYVQGGGCTSVGAAGGFMQGGGFGSWSKKYGTGAASMLEAEVVTADGKLRIANACQNQDLFWALRGGGGGTFGVVTKVILMTHPLPTYFGQVLGSITAKNDTAFADLLEHFVRFYGERLSNEFWGEQVSVRGNDSLDLAMVFQGMTAKEAERVWEPFRTWIDAHPESFAVHIDTIEIPGDKMWNSAYIQEHFPSALVRDPRPGQSGDRYWWIGDQGEISTYWYTYQSRWIPADHFDGSHAKSFAKSLFEASRHWTVTLHFNKGQAGASAEAIQRDRETSMNPAVYQAAALAILAAEGEGYPGVRGHEPHREEGEVKKARVSAAMKILRDATPGAGTYLNETDYFEPHWQESFWGENYPKLLGIKRKYDPDGFFTCHHCVGSE